jgi:hypothetical protein
VSAITRLLAALLISSCVVVLSPARARAQAARQGRLLITVVDATNAVIPGAVVRLVGIDDTTKKLQFEPTKTSDKGIATFERLPLGRYSVQGEFPGFKMGLVRDIRVRAGDNKHVMVLPLEGFAEEVTVGRDKLTSAADRAGTFGTALTREQVEALSDDPDEMQRQLQDMAGPGAVIRVDSFEGQQLPPKAQIKAVHITRDSFAAESHAAGMMFIDIITQPGVGPMRGSTRFGFYDSRLDGQNPLIPKKGPGQNRSFGANVGGSLIKERSSFSISFSGSDNYRTPNLYAQVPTGLRAESLNLRVPSNNYMVMGLFDYAITKDQTLRLSAYRFTFSNENQGVGGYNLIERAYSSNNASSTIRIQEAGPIGRRFFTNTRLAMNLSDSDSRSVLEAPTVVVNDAFTGGGAQQIGGSHTRTFNLQSDLDYVRGIQSWRFGIQLDGGSYRSDSASNYLGTYTFESLAAYNAGTPRTFMRRIGDPNISYSYLQAGLYVQDDLRIRKNLTLSPGVRFEAQTHLRDLSNVGPRFGVTWAPFKSGKTTLRASWGIFYDWLSTGTYAQTLQVDGFRQQEVILVNPDYPDPGALGGAPPINRYLLGPDAQMSRNVRVSAGINQDITKIVKLGATYSDVHATGLMTGINLNAPVNGIRPDPRFANILQTMSAGRARSQSLSTNASLSFSPPMMGQTVSGPRFSWKRGLSVYTSYTVARSMSDTEGPFSVPASGTLATEWGPSSGYGSGGMFTVMSIGDMMISSGFFGSDVRHRVSVSLYSSAIKNLTAMVSLSASSGSPYTIRTGYDDNGDSIFNDRPAGVGRGTLRTAGSWNSYGYFTYTIGLGRRTVALPPGISITSSGGNLSVGTVAREPAPRYRLAFTVSVSNLTNHANWTGYNGSMISPFFMKPTSVSGVRSVNLSTMFSF